MPMISSYSIANTYPTFVNSFPWTLRKLRLNLLFSWKKMAHIKHMKIYFQIYFNSKVQIKHFFFLSNTLYALQQYKFLPLQPPVCQGHPHLCPLSFLQSLSHLVRPRFLFADHGGVFVEPTFSLFLFPLPFSAQQLRPTIIWYNLNASNFSTCWFTFKNFIPDWKNLIKKEFCLSFLAIHVLPFSWLHQTDWEDPPWL